MSSILSAFATSVALPVLTAALGAMWKMLAKPGLPSSEDWSLALELLLAAVVVQMTYLAVDVVQVIGGPVAAGTSASLGDRGSRCLVAWRCRSSRYGARRAIPPSRAPT